MRTLILSLSLSSLALVACGGLSGQFKGKSLGTPVPPSQVQTIRSKADASGSYTELGIAKGTGPTAQEAVDQAKFHCGNAGGNMLIMNTDPFQSGKNWAADATCATNRDVSASSNGSPGAPPPGTSGPGRPAQ